MGQPYEQARRLPHHLSTTPYGGKPVHDFPFPLPSQNAKAIWAMDKDRDRLYCS